MDIKKKDVRPLQDGQIRNRQRLSLPRLIMAGFLFLILVLRYLVPALSQGDSYGGYGGLGGEKRPNFIFIITDDQDLRMNSIDYQPKVKQYFADEGLEFKQHFCTVSLCCPSRVSLLTGKAAHNTNITDVGPPYGGYPKFVKDGWNDKYLPMWLQDAGYNTYYTGKLMNAHSIYTYDKPYPKGWNATNYLIDPGTYLYYNSITQRNEEPPKQNPELYSTDIVAADAVGFLAEAAISDRPFFLGVAPIAPHSETTLGENGAEFRAPVAAERHRDLFPGILVPRNPNFNPDVSSGGGFIKGLDQLNDTVVQYNDEFFRARIQSLQAVDELIVDIFDWLDAHPDILENTYIIYTSDNGYHISQHRLPPGKTCGIEEDINIPFFIRGPGIEKGKTVSYATTHTDIVPTLFNLAGITLHDDFDGEPMIGHPDLDSEFQRTSEHVNVEFWGTGLFEGIYSPEGEGLEPSGGLIDVLGPNNTYKTVRVISDDFDIAYTVWCTNEHELYDMRTDPYQMNNLYGSEKGAGVQVSDHELEKLVPRVDALLLTLKACKGKICTRPWETLHPAGDVKSLKDAMHSKFDRFYLEEQQRVRFDGCAEGYLPWLEQPEQPLGFTDRTGRIRRAARWEDWT